MAVDNLNQHIVLIIYLNLLIIGSTVIELLDIRGFELNLLNVLQISLSDFQRSTNCKSLHYTLIILLKEVNLVCSRFVLRISLGFRLDFHLIGTSQQGIVLRQSIVRLFRNQLGFTSLGSNDIQSHVLVVHTRHHLHVECTAVGVHNRTVEVDSKYAETDDVTLRTYFSEVQNLDVTEVIFLQDIQVLIDITLPTGQFRRIRLQSELLIELNDEALNLVVWNNVALTILYAINADCNLITNSNGKEVLILTIITISFRTVDSVSLFTLSDNCSSRNQQITILILEILNPLIFGNFQGGNLFLIITKLLATLIAVVDILHALPFAIQTLHVEAVTGVFCIRSTNHYIIT